MLKSSYTLATVGSLCGVSYGSAIVFSILWLLIAVLIVNGIATQPGAAGSKASIRKRRVVFWIMAVLCPGVVFLVNQFVFLSHVKGAPAVDKFTTTYIIATAVSFLIYVVLGLVMSKTLMKNKNLSTVF
ncbi:MAG: hypothetical protein HUK20_11805 [Fibrobacter sp.]|nr:hypothetical protein [Fibrobacter sp.]